MTTVLFVCVHNAARSQIAEAFFNEFTSDRHRGVSAGSQPAERVNPKAVKAMAEVGIDISGTKPKSLTADLVEEADIVVTLGCGENVCPIVPKEVIEWDLEDPSEKSLKRVKEIRDQIREKVLQLIDRIGQTACSSEPNLSYTPSTIRAHEMFFQFFRVITPVLLVNSYNVIRRA